MNDATQPTRYVVNKIFGDSIPDTTGDERDDAASADGAERERWLRDNVPPHHA
ncbi:MAG: hypothetical protein QOI25_5282 [Mycobacterium sp.]|nr:hypothetical protein [Mycobacterium sp.]